eukprot:scaffold99403_cov19-Tisochrysis_lutea.AAC.3
MAIRAANQVNVSQAALLPKHSYHTMMTSTSDLHSAPCLLKSLTFHVTTFMSSTLAHIQHPDPLRLICTLHVTTFSYIQHPDPLTHCYLPGHHICLHSAP